MEEGGAVAQCHELGEGVGSLFAWDVGCIASLCLGRERRKGCSLGRLYVKRGRGYLRQASA